MTPLGFGTAIILSAGIGFALAFLRNRLKNGLSEYEKMIEKVKKKLKEEESQTTYSNELIKLVYEGTKLIAKQDYSAASLKSIKSRMKVLEDLQAYNLASIEFGNDLVDLTEYAFSKIIKEAGGCLKMFIQAERERKNHHQEMMKAYQDLIGQLKSDSPLRATKKQLTDELVREILFYESSLLERIFAEKLMDQLAEPIVILIWISDMVYDKYEVNMNTTEYKKAFLDLVGRDPELKQVNKKVGGMMSQIFKIQSQR